MDFKAKVLESLLSLSKLKQYFISFFIILSESKVFKIIL